MYAAHVIVPGLRDPGIAALDAMQRASNTVKKDVLLIQVVAPTLTSEELRIHDCFWKMEITVILLASFVHFIQS